MSTSGVKHVIVAGQIENTDDLTGFLGTNGVVKQHSVPISCMDCDLPFLIRRSGRNGSQ